MSNSRKLKQAIGGKLTRPRDQWGPGKWRTGERQGAVVRRLPVHRWGPMNNEQDAIAGYVLGLMSFAMMRRPVTFHR